MCVCVCVWEEGGLNFDLKTEQQTIHGKVSPGLPPPSLVPSLASVVIVDLTPYYLHESYVTFEVVLVNEAYEDVLNNNGFRLMCFTQRISNNKKAKKKGASGVLGGNLILA